MYKLILIFILASCSNSDELKQCQSESEIKDQTINILSRQKDSIEMEAFHNYDSLNHLIDSKSDEIATVLEELRQCLNPTKP